MYPSKGGKCLMDEKTAEKNLKNAMELAEALIKFAEELAALMERDLFENYGLQVEAETYPVMKTNVEKQGITVHFDGSIIAPVIYVDDVYQQYMDGDLTISEISKKMCESVYEAHKRSPKLPELTPEEARKHITLTLVNSEKNQQLLDKTPHFKFLGGELSAIPRWYLDENASFVVSNDMCGTLGLTPDEVLLIGQQHINNQHFEAKTMQEVLTEMMGGDFMDMMPPGEGPQMIVLSSENKIQGANALLSEAALDHVHEMIGDFCVLPSSIHEVICVPITENMKPEEMRSMVREVNMGQVAPEERLSDQVFKHDGQKLTVVGESFKMEEPKLNAPKMDRQSVRMAM